MNKDLEKEFARLQKRSERTVLVNELKVRLYQVIANFKSDHTSLKLSKADKQRALAEMLASTFK